MKSEFGRGVTTLQRLKNALTHMSRNGLPKSCTENCSFQIGDHGDRDTSSSISMLKSDAREGLFRGFSQPELAAIDGDHSRSRLDTAALIFARKDGAIAATWQRQDARSTFRSRPRPQVSRDRFGCMEKC